MPILPVDLHQHSTYSDGTSTPAQLVDRAASMALTAMALTDHDTTAGLDECARLAAEAGIPFIPGVEFEASEGPHLLGYFGGSRGPGVADAAGCYRSFRTSGVEAMIEQLRAIGYALDPATIVRRAGAGTPHVGHIVAEMFELGHLSSQDRTNAEFARFFGPRGPAPIPDLTAIEWPAVRLVQMLRESGAVVVLAHPSKNHLPLWPAMVEAGLQGVEAYNRNAHVSGEVADFINLAEQHRLIVTGGWDFHGDAQINRIANSDLATFAPPDEILGPLLDLTAAVAA